MSEGAELREKISRGESVREWVMSEVSSRIDAGGARPHGQRQELCPVWEAATRERSRGRAETYGGYREANIVSVPGCIDGSPGASFATLPPVTLTSSEGASASRFRRSRAIEVRGALQRSGC